LRCPGADGSRRKQPAAWGACQDAGIVTAIISDLHLGARMSVLATPPARERLLDELSGVDRLVLLGDTLSLRAGPVADVLELAAPALADLAHALARRQVTIVPGNHDHRLVEPLLERRRLELDPDPLPLEQTITPADAGPAGAVAGLMQDVDLRLAYPGLWIRPDVYATHGHYADCHMSAPRVESLCAAGMARATGGLPRRSARPDDYEAVLAPLYAFAYSRAQVNGRDPLAGEGTGGMWTTVTAAARARLRDDGGWRQAPAGMLGGLVLLGGVGALRLAGLSQFRRELSPTELGRSGLRAAAEVMGRLGVAADHIVLGHTHYAGPLDGEEGWTLPNGTRLHNAGSWVWEEDLLGDGGAADPYWPGRAVFVGDTGPPQLRLLLDESGARAS
jgi:calcineurin-like phosphoesterase family protein